MPNPENGRVENNVAEEVVGAKGGAPHESRLIPMSLWPLKHVMLQAGLSSLYPKNGLATMFVSARYPPSQNSAAFETSHWSENREVGLHRVPP